MSGCSGQDGDLGGTFVHKLRGFQKLAWKNLIDHKGHHLWGCGLPRPSMAGRSQSCQFKGQKEGLSALKTSQLH